MRKAKRRHVPSISGEQNMRKAERRRARKTKIQYLPEDIIVEILSRLPVKSLMKLKTVCRQWKSLISYKNFRYCNYGRHREKPLFFFRRTRKESSLRSYFSLNRELHVEEFYNPYSGYELLGTCDGLLLFGYGKNIYLWNPSTKYSKTVHHLLSLGKGYRRMLASGFCYDESVDDYKVVIIISQATKSEAKIYAFFSHLNSVTWTKFRCPFDVLRTDSVAPLVSGNLHFVAKEDDGKNREKEDQHQHTPQLIVYFDIKRDEFKLLPKPNAKHDGQNVIYGLGVIDGCLCMVRPEKDCREVLSMKEYGVKESWTIMFTIVHSCINVPGYALVPVFLTNEGQVIMVENHRKVLAYDLNMKSIRHIGLETSNQTLFGFTYVETVADWNQARPLRRKRNNKLSDFIYFSDLDFL